MKKPLPKPPCSHGGFPILANCDKILLSELVRLDCAGSPAWPTGVKEPVLVAPVCRIRQRRRRQTGASVAHPCKAALRQDAAHGATINLQRHPVGETLNTKLKSDKTLHKLKGMPASKPQVCSQIHKLNKAACLTFIAPQRHSTDHCHHYLQGDHDAASA